MNDLFGMPQPTFDFTLGDNDRKRAHEMLGDMTAAAALGGYLTGSEPRFMPLGSSLHFMGTYRMGEANDGTSVTDPQSRVWGYGNLYLGGNGIIPTSTACNPTLTSIALATRASAALLGKTPAELAASLA
jgi:pyranose oxidase